MAKQKSKPKRRAPLKANAVKRGIFKRLTRLLFWTFGLGVFTVVLLTAVYAIFNPPTTPYIFSEARKIEGPAREWVDFELIAPVMARSVVAAEDANFCNHWGLDVNAIRSASASGVGGASTISQQTIKNLYLWQGRSWTRKTIEALWTPLAESMWSKKRILELYLNIVEFDSGVFGIQAASRHYFDRDAYDLNARQAALLAAVLPLPKQRNAAKPTRYLTNRALSIEDGAATIAADGRAECFAH